MQNITDIPLQEGEEIIWQGKAQLPGQAVHEYIPMLILVLIYANSLHLLYPVEPLSMLHEFCSGNLAGGILVLGIIFFSRQRPPSNGRFLPTRPISSPTAELLPSAHRGVCSTASRRSR